MTTEPLRLLPYGRQCIDDEDIAAVVDCLKSDWLTTGPQVAAFEDEFCKVTGASHAAACSSGTAALHLAAAALDLGPGTAAIVPSMTFAATANCVRYAGAEVVFADVDPDSGLMGPEHVLAALSQARGQNVKALFAVHLNGHVADLLALAKLSNARGLALVEDACHALGGSYVADGVRRGVGDCTHGRLAAFSFHPVKTITTGEGGMVATADAGLDQRVRLLRNHGLERNPALLVNADAAFEDDQPNPWYYELAELGWNYRASDINCALGRSQLKKLDRFLASRRRLAAEYDRLLAPHAPLIKPVKRPPNQEGGWHLYVVHVDFAAAGITRSRLMRILAEQAIQTQVHYIPVHRHPYYESRYGVLNFPGADTYYERCLSLPLFPAMIAGDVERVVTALAQALGA